MQIIREVYFYKHYFLDFYESQNARVQLKIEWTIQLIQTNAMVPKKYFKHVEGQEGLYEMRIECQGNTFRVFCFFDEGKLVVLCNGFQKKTSKTPKKEIERAMKIKKEYNNDKGKADDWF